MHWGWYAVGGLALGGAAVGGYYVYKGRQRRRRFASAIAKTPALPRESLLVGGNQGLKQPPQAKDLPLSQAPKGGGRSVLDDLEQGIGIAERGYALYSAIEG